MLLVLLMPSTLALASRRRPLSPSVSSTGHVTSQMPGHWPSIEHCEKRRSRGDSIRLDLSLGGRRDRLRAVGSRLSRSLTHPTTDDAVATQADHPPLAAMAASRRLGGRECERKREEEVAIGLE